MPSENRPYIVLCSIEHCLEVSSSSLSSGLFLGIGYFNFLGIMYRVLGFEFFGIMRIFGYFGYSPYIKVRILRDYRNAREAEIYSLYRNFG